MKTHKLDFSPIEKIITERHDDMMFPSCDGQVVVEQLLEAIDALSFSASLSDQGHAQALGAISNLAQLTKAFLAVKEIPENQEEK